MNKQELIEKITKKKEFSKLRDTDVEKALSVFDKNLYTDSEKVKMTRDLLRRVFSVFTSKKLLNMRDYDKNFILKKHISTKERFDFYFEVYSKLLKNLNGNVTIFDLGAGVNGFSYDYFPRKISYVGVESIGQLVDLMNFYFNKKGFSNAEAIHLSLFELDKIKKLISKKNGKKILFLFKVIDSLEMLERNYSKKLLLDLAPLVDRVVVSFATESLIKRKKFKVKRFWIENFIKENFNILEDFSVGSERYIVFCK